MRFLSVVVACVGVAQAVFAAAQGGFGQSAATVGNLAPANSTNSSNSSQASNITIVPSGTKTYVAGVRATINGTNQCAASLITPTHLLVGSYCVYYNIRWASIGSHYSNGTQDGEQIKIVAILNYPESSSTNFSSDLAIIQLERPSSFAPVSLGSADDLDLKVGERAIKIGWNDSRGSGDEGYQLKRAEVQLISDEECSQQTVVDGSTQICARGIPNNKCWGYGGPLVVEHPGGDELIAMATFGPGCRTMGAPFIYSRLAKARKWIESVVGGMCFH